MRIIKESTLNHAAKYYNDRGIKSHLASWKALIKRAEYQTPQDLKQHYRNASIINSNRVVFNIKGNEFRLIVDINYQWRIIYIIDLLTHQEYDRVNVEQLTYEQSKFYQKSG